MSKLWTKNHQKKLDPLIEVYTVGNDYLLDLELIPYDVQASIAHATMLKKIGILTSKELITLTKGLKKILEQAKTNTFKITPEDEDGHTAIENFLTKNYGEVGKKIHTGRSRNDQILVTIRLFSKDALKDITALTKKLETLLRKLVTQHAKTKMPGYTHMQPAMPSTVSMWLQSYADSMADTLTLIHTTAHIIDQNPLGSVASYGEQTLGLDRDLTTKLLHFKKTQRNPMYCAMSRGKFELITLQTLSHVMLDLSKLASDLLRFTMKELNFFDLPLEFKTGSSVMPQKQNFDVLEILRANYGVFTGYETQIRTIIANLPSGYNRDLQLTKEPYLKGIKLVKDSLKIMRHTLQHLIVNTTNLAKACTPELSMADQAYALVKQGKPFRDAYREISDQLN